MLTQVALVRAEMAKEGLAALALPLDEVETTSMTFVIIRTVTIIIHPGGSVGMGEWVFWKQRASCSHNGPGAPLDRWPV